MTPAFTCRAGLKATKLTSRSVRGVPAGSTVVARCPKVVTRCIPAGACG